jgi:hypothetical protein
MAKLLWQDDEDQAEETSAAESSNGQDASQ